MGITLLHWLPATATAVLIASLSHQSSLPDLPGGLEIPDWTAHFLEYGLFTLTLVFATTRGFEKSSRTPARVGVAVAIACLYGITDEWHQSFVVAREASVRDWVVDIVGAVVMAALILVAWRRMAAPESRV